MDEVYTIPWEGFVGASSGPGGALLAIAFVIAALLGLLIIGIINLIIDIVVWISQLIGLLGSDPLPNGIFPDPYFTGVLELLLFAVIAAGAFQLLFFLKPIGDNAPLGERIRAPTLTLILPTGLLIYTYSLFRHIPEVTPLVMEHLPIVDGVALYFLTGFAAVWLANRARRLATETTLLTDILSNHGGNGVVSNIESSLSVAYDGVTLASIGMYALIGFWYVFTWMVDLTTAEDGRTASGLLVLTPNTDLLFTALVFTAVAAAVISVVKRSVVNTARVTTYLVNR